MFLTEGLARHVQQTRRAQIVAVLLEQRRQEYQGIHDVEALSTLSKKKSCWSKERAVQLATGYSNF